MSKKFEKIIKKAIDNHKAISDRYYSDPENYPGGKTQFDIDHAKVWIELDTELVNNGFRDDV